MQPISLSDTIEDFMTKCNANFNEISERSGPQGRPGEDGHIGATGKRGTSIRFVNCGDTNPEFTQEDANAAIYNMGDTLEVGDVVVFSSGWIGGVENVTEEGSEYIPTVGGLSSIIGPQGEQGIAGSQASDQFEDDGLGNLKLKNNFSGLRISRGNSQTQLIVDRVSFNYGGSTKGYIEATGNEFGVTSSLTFSLNSNNIVVGNHQSTNNIKINSSTSLNVGTAVNFIDIDNASGIKVQGDSEFSGTSKFNNDVTFYKNGQSTSISGDSITTDSVKADKLTIGINTPATYANRKLTVDGSGINFVGRLDVKPGEITTSLPIKSDSTIKVKSGNEYVTLDCPKYSMMLWPDGSDCPANWVALNKNIYISGVDRMGTSLQNGEISDTALYFKFNNYIYKVANYTSKISDTLVVSLEQAQITDEEIAEYIASPDSRTRLTAPETPLSFRINNTGHTGFTDRPLSSDPSQMLASAFADYSEIFLDGDLAEALEPTALPERLVSSYAGFLKNMLKVRVDGADRYYKDMTGVFTLLKKAISQTTNLSFVFGRPQAPAGFMWIFKNA